MMFDIENRIPSWYPKTAWSKHFAFLPVIIHGKRYWGTTVYKRYIYYRDIPGNVEYGTILDVLRDVK